MFGSSSVEMNASSMTKNKFDFQFAMLLAYLFHTEFKVVGWFYGCHVIQKILIAVISDKIVIIT